MEAGRMMDIRREDYLAGLAVILAILIGLVGAFIGWRVQAEPYSTEAVLRLDRRALDEAYVEHLRKLFVVWLSEGAADPARISSGIAVSRRAYQTASQQIEKREKELRP
jgi:hypothetical protein